MFFAVITQSFLRCVAQGYTVSLLGAFAKSRKRLLASSRLCLCVCLLIRESTGLPLDRFWCDLILEALKSANKIQIWSKSDKNIGHFTRRPKYVCIVDIFCS